NVNFATLINDASTFRNISGATLTNQNQSHFHNTNGGQLIVDSASFVNVDGATIVNTGANTLLVNENKSTFTNAGTNYCFVSPPCFRQVSTFKNQDGAMVINDNSIIQNFDPNGVSPAYGQIINTGDNTIFTNSGHGVIDNASFLNQKHATLNNVSA